MTLKDKKPKKSTLKFNLDLTHPVEDGIFDSGHFEQFLLEKFKGPSTGASIVVDLGYVTFLVWMCSLTWMFLKH
uniref:Uncharacterized protein n=2 Tax=Canis lupus familiaris TaxID=9615 RepID=A0A8C0RKS7_CANLF